MSDVRKRPRFGLRLLLLVVALFAAFFAWRHAVEQRQSAERERQRIALEEQLTGEEQRRAVISRTLNESRNSPERQRMSAVLAPELRKIDARISALRESLNEIMPQAERERLKQLDEEKRREQILEGWLSAE